MKYRLMYFYARVMTRMGLTHDPFGNLSHQWGKSTSLQMCNRADDIKKEEGKQLVQRPGRHLTKFQFDLQSARPTWRTSILFWGETHDDYSNQRRRFATSFLLLSTPTDQLELCRIQNWESGWFLLEWTGDSFVSIILDFYQNHKTTLKPTYCVISE